MVRSKLEVGVPVWSSHRKENWIKIKGVRRRATKFILQSDIGYKDRLSACGLMPLSLRREMLDLSCSSADKDFIPLTSLISFPNTVQ